MYEHYHATKYGKMNVVCSRIEGEEQSNNFVLLHGLIVSSDYMMPLAEELAKRHDVYVPDFVGHGKSDTPDHPLDVYEHAEALIGWMRDERISNAILIGGSYGCQVAVELAIKAPDLVRGLILIGPIDQRRRSIFGNLMALLHDGFVEPIHMIPMVFSDVMRIGIMRSVKGVTFMLDYPTLGKLRRMKKPVFLIRGAMDRLGGHEWIETIRKYAPDTWFAQIPKSAHAAPQTDPELLADLAEKFSRAA